MEKWNGVFFSPANLSYGPVVSYITLMVGVYGGMKVDIYMMVVSDRSLDKQSL